MGLSPAERNRRSERAKDRYVERVIDEEAVRDGCSSSGSRGCFRQGWFAALSSSLYSRDVARDSVTKNPEFREAIDIALANGWRVDRTKGSHWVFLSPDKNVRPVYTSGTPSDRNAIKKILADLRRAGLPLPRTQHDASRPRSSRSPLRHIAGFELDSTASGKRQAARIVRFLRERGYYAAVSRAPADKYGYRAWGVLTDAHERVFSRAYSATSRA